MAERHLVAGWIFSATEPLRDQLVLAFCGPRNVGTGRVEIFRADLLDAGLGDGYCGFYFPIRLAADEDPASVIIRLADCDAALIQPASRVCA